MSGLYVPATAITNEPPRHGLLDSAEELEAPDRWTQGVQLRGEGCGTISSWNPNCAIWPDGNKPDFAEPGIVTWEEYDPFEVYTELTCEVSGGTEPNEEIIRIAERQLELGRSKAMEAEIWTGAQNITGVFGGSRNFQTDATVVNTEPVGYGFGLAVAGQALANCGLGSRGFIHAPPLVVAMWTADGFLEEDDRGRLVTVVRGDVVVAGSGYPGTGPNGSPISGNQSWIFATGPVAYKLGDVEVYTRDIAQSIDRTTNTLTIRAAQQAIVAFDPCCQFAVLVGC